MAASPARRLGVVLLAAVAAVGMWAVLDAVSLHSYVADSDGATVVLQGWTILHGHVLLKGWTLSLDPFWTIDALWYTVAVAFVGITPSLMYAVPAAMATACIVLGIVMATEGQRGRAALLAAVPVVAILGFPTQALAIFLLRGPLHVGTVCWCLVAFLALRRGSRAGYAVAVLFLALGLLGDLQTLPLGVAPVFLAGITGALRTRMVRTGAPLVATAVASVVVAEVVRKIAEAIGSYTVTGNPRAPLHQMLLNVRHGAHEAIVLLGFSGDYFGTAREPLWLSYLHVISVIVVLGAAAAALVALVWGIVRGRTTVVGVAGREAWRLDDLLVFGGIASCVTFVVAAFTPTPQFARYLTAAVIFGAILAGRIVGRLAGTVRSEALLRALVAVALAVTCAYASAVALDIDQPRPSSGPELVAKWLAHHHLHHGVGAYWSASVVTVESGGSVDVRPVVDHGGRLVRYDRVSSAAWYRHRVNFLIFQPGAPWGGVDNASGVATFGPPSRTYNPYGYRVLVWDHPLTVSPKPG